MDEKDVPAVLPEELETTVTDPQVKEDEGESTGAESGAVETKEEGKDEGHDLVVAGDQPAPVKETPDKAKERNREFARLRARNAELEREREARTQPATVADPGDEPTEASCGWDIPEFKKQWVAWNHAKQAKATADAQAAQDAQKAQGERQQKLAKYAEAKAEISTKLTDYPELEATVATGLSQVQRDVILHYTENPTLVIAALGRSPERLQDFANTKDLGLLIAKAAKLEARTELKSKTTTPAPERRVTGSGSKAGGSDKELERLQAVADKTGDRTPVVNYLRDKRRAATAKG